MEFEGSLFTTTARTFQATAPADTKKRLEAQPLEDGDYDKSSRLKRELTAVVRVFS